MIAVLFVLRKFLRAYRCNVLGIPPATARTPKFRIQKLAKNLRFSAPIKRERNSSPGGLALVAEISGSKSDQKSKIYQSENSLENPAKIEAK